MIKLDKDNLQDIVNSNATVVVQYGASWCGSCRMVKPQFEKLSGTQTDKTFVYVDAEAYPNSRKMAQVSNLPTFALFKDGRLVQQTQGSKIDLVEEMIK